MPAIVHEKKQFYKACIRSLLAIDHQITGAEIAAKLESENIHIDRRFLAKLTNDIYKERTGGHGRAMWFCGQTALQLLAVFSRPSVYWRGDRD
jgi:hypothetical protein